MSKPGYSVCQYCGTADALVQCRAVVSCRPEDFANQCPCCGQPDGCDCEVVTLTGDDRDTGPYSNTGCITHGRCV